MSDLGLKREVGTPVKAAAQMLKGGVMDVVTPEQAKIAEDARRSRHGSRARPRRHSRPGVARMSDPDLIEGIIEAVPIPVMAKACIGHLSRRRSCKPGCRLHATSPRC